MAYKDNMNSNDNYGENNRVPPGSNEEKVQQARQRTTGIQPVINNDMGDPPRRNILGVYNELTKH